MTDLDPAWLPLPVREGDEAVDLTLLEAAIRGPASEEIAAPSELVYLDCGAWMGDGKAMPAQRSFGVVCGRTAVLCSFSGTRPVELLTEGPSDEIEPINQLLLALAGPMRFDVTVHRAVVSRGITPPHDPSEDGERVVRLLLPELRLPLVPRLPDVDPGLVPDPNKATCSCHGPVVTRMLYGTPSVPSRYRAVGAPLSRNPNDWFYWMAESYRPVADDLLKLLDRLGKHGARAPVDVIQLGGACEIWSGYRCVLQTAGRVALVRPTIINDLGPAELLAAWSDKTIATKSRDVIKRLVGLRRAVLLHASGRASFEAPGQLHAEACPPDADEDSPVAFLALREQKVRFVPARVEHEPGYRLPILVHALRKAEERRVGIYATAGTQSPCLMTIRYPRRLPDSHTRYACVA